ncbi:DUF4129 domain-containing protein [Microbacterium sp. ZW T5_45]|uniref:DUF4129 domain-containing protein n=1 Tax=Microbacterium sp. ZW T5_45 TaxID=3378080 RepID=UPI003854B63D
MTLRFDDVVVPDGDEVRKWAEQELADPKYADAKPTWFDLFARDVLRFIGDLFNGNAAGGLGPGGLIVVCAIIVAALVVALIVWGRPRARHAVHRPMTGLLGADDDRTAAQLRADAERSAGAGDWDDATVLRFRALARDLMERDLIDPAPGATAQSIARDVGAVFAAETAAVRSAAVSFDDVRYLRHPATQESYQTLAATDDRLRALRLAAVPV